MTPTDAAAVGLLVAGAATMLVRPRGVPVWAGPAVAALIGLGTTAIEVPLATGALAVVLEPLLFLAFAVPLAVALDRLGVFEALAATVGGGRHLVAGLWVLGAAVTAVFNLDAAVVLLTPLYIRIARRHRIAPEVLALQPAMLACLASCPLPVSNLTNLLVAEEHGLGTLDFLRHLGPATVAAVAVGGFAYRRAVPAHVPVPPASDRPDRRALARGLPLVVLVLAGFTAGPSIGVPVWATAAVALAVALALGRSAAPVRTVPLEAMLVAAGLAVLVAGALPHVDLPLGASGAVGRAQALAFGAVASDLTNNLPAVLAASPSLASPDQVWALLVGVNTGPALVITGALSGLLWRDTAHRLGVAVSARRYSAVGLRVGLPALVAAAAVVIWAP